MCDLRLLKANFSIRLLLLRLEFPTGKFDRLRRRHGCREIIVGSGHALSPPPPRSLFRRRRVALYKRRVPRTLVR